MYDRNGVRLSLVHSLPAVAEALGERLDMLLPIGGLASDAMRDHSRVVRRSQINAILQGLARRSGDASVGFRMAAATDPCDLGLSGLSLGLGRTLRESLALHARHLPGLQQGVQVWLVEEGRLARWMHRMLDSDAMEARVLTEGIAAFFVRAVRSIVGDPAAQLHVSLPHRPVAPLRVYEDALRCAVSFVPGHDLTIQFDARLLQEPNRLCVRPQAGTIAASRTDSAVPATTDLADDALMDGLALMIEAGALIGRLSLQDAAVTLGVPPRSLQRRLSGMGASYEELVDRWRRRQAVALLVDTRQSMAEIATRLGYSEASHFIRAFRRWNGTTPSAFRAERAAADLAPRA